MIRPLILILFAFAMSARAQSAADTPCYERWGEISNAAARAIEYAPQAKHRALREALDITLEVQDSLRLDSRRYLVDLCGDRLSRAALWPLAWKVSGWLPTEKELAEARRTKLLNRIDVYSADDATTGFDRKSAPAR